MLICSCLNGGINEPESQRLHSRFAICTYDGTKKLVRPFKSSSKAAKAVKEKCFICCWKRHSIYPSALILVYRLASKTAGGRFKYLIPWGTEMVALDNGERTSSLLLWFIIDCAQLGSGSLNALRLGCRVKWNPTNKLILTDSVKGKFWRPWCCSQKLASYPK